MTSARRIAEEIANGGAALIAAVLEELHLLHGWQSGPPTETPHVEIVMRDLPKFKYVEYDTPAAIAKAKGARGRWMKQETDGTWKTAKLPHHITWRPL